MHSHDDRGGGVRRHGAPAYLEFIEEVGASCTRAFRRQRIRDYGVVEVYGPGYTVTCQCDEREERRECRKVVLWVLLLLNARTKSGDDIKEQNRMKKRSMFFFSFPNSALPDRCCVPSSISPIEPEQNA